MIHPSEAAVIQREVARAFGEPEGVRDMAALKAALSRPFATRQGIPVYPTLFAKAGAMFQGLLMERPFEGANRRTSLCILALVLQSRGYRLECDLEDLKRMLPGIELGFTSWHRVAAWIKGCARREGPRAGRGGLE